MEFRNISYHYDDVIMGVMASPITSIAIVYSTIYSDADQRKHHSSASLAFVRGIHRRPVNSPHKWPVTRKMFPFHDVIMLHFVYKISYQSVEIILKKFLDDPVVHILMDLRDKKFGCLLCFRAAILVGCWEGIMGCFRVASDIRSLWWSHCSEPIR